MLHRLAACDQQWPRRQPGEEEHEGGGVRVLRDLFDGDREAEDAGAGAAVLLGHAQPGQAGLDEELEEVLGILLGEVDLPRPGRNSLLGELAHGGLELRQLGRQVEVHGARKPTVPTLRNLWFQTPQKAGVQ